MAPREKVRARRRALAGLAVTVVLVGVAIFGVLPTTTWWQQRNETDQLRSELADVRAELAEVEAEQARLETPQEIERRARDELGFVNPGEEAFSILPAPTDPIGLPEGWPFTGVERVFGAR